jgi:dynein heavy chain 1
MDDRRPSTVSSPLLEGERERGPPPTVPTFNLQQFNNYLLKLLPLLIDAQEDDLQQLLELPDYAERATRWAGDPNAGALYVLKSRDEREDEDDGEQSGAFISRYN